MPKVILDVKLYSTQEVAALLDVTTATITKYVKEGRMEAKTIGGKRYISEESLRKFLLGDK